MDMNVKVKYKKAKVTFSDRRNGTTFIRGFGIRSNHVNHPFRSEYYIHIVVLDNLTNSVYVTSLRCTFQAAKSAYPESLQFSHL
jgi:hypothetical protein